MVHWKVNFELELEDGSIEYYVESIQDILEAMSTVGYGTVRGIIDVNSQTVLAADEVLEFNGR